MVQGIVAYLGYSNSMYVMNTQAHILANCVASHAV